MPFRDWHNFQVHTAAWCNPSSWSSAGESSNDALLDRTAGETQSIELPALQCLSQSRSPPFGRIVLPGLGICQPKKTVQECMICSPAYPANFAAIGHTCSTPIYILIYRASEFCAAASSLDMQDLSSKWFLAMMYSASSAINLLVIPHIYQCLAHTSKCR